MAPSPTAYERRSYTPVRQDSTDGKETPTPMSRDDSGDSAEYSVPYDYDAVFDSLSLGDKIKYSLACRARRRRSLVVVALSAVTLLFMLLVASYSAYTHVLDTNWLPLFVDEAEEAYSAPDGVIPLDNDYSHVLVPDRDLPPPPKLLTPLSARPALDLLVEYYVHGLPLTTDPNNYTQPPIDLVYLYVNSSSPYFLDAQQSRGEVEGLSKGSGRGKHYRDNGELRGAMRSGALALGDAVRTIHVVSGAFDFDPDLNDMPTQDEMDTMGADYSSLKGWRMGQVPSWLDWENKGNVKYHFHPDIYRLPRDNDGTLHADLEGIDEDLWRNDSLPTFNSFAIEARVGWLDGLSDQFIFSNDDMFIRNDVAVADFVHPLFGNVLRVDFNLQVKPELTPDLKSTGGEWGGLQHASKLISSRFPKKSRGYVLHYPKTFSRQIAHEASVMFAPQLTEAATRAFRESKRGVADVEFAWLLTYLRIERWREALLWSYIIARLGGTEGIWGLDARDELFRVLGIELGSEETEITITRKPRTTLDDMNNINKNAGWDNPERTYYRWSSFDGHLPSESVVANGLAVKQCVFNTRHCLPRDFVANGTEHSAEDMFRAMAFERPACGDCLIDALMNASGKRGLSAFLPSANATFVPPKRARRQWDRTEPMLPLTSNWEDADFTLEGNVRRGQDTWLGVPGREDGAVSLLHWTVKLLSRYAYVYSYTPCRFFQVRELKNMRNIVDDLEKAQDVTLLCINDDQPDKYDARVRTMFQRWMEDSFGGESEYVGWERPGVPWT